MITAPAPQELPQTPALLLDVDRMANNHRRLSTLLALTSTQLRLHVKTLKCVPALAFLFGDARPPITVSTLKEAEIFGAAGYRDILYAVGLAPDKIDRVRAIRSGGIDLTVIVDNVAAAKAVAATGSNPIPTLIEIDADGHRAGLRAGDRAALAQVADPLFAAGCLRGTMAHSGGSYLDRSPDAIAMTARVERQAVAQAADVLEERYGCARLLRSVGSTPAAHVPDLGGDIDEIRAGVFLTFDLVMLALGVARLDDLALSVLATVIGHQIEKSWIIVDAGWTALSRDAGGPGHVERFGFGLVADPQGVVYEGLTVTALNQEHGILTMRADAGRALPDLSVGAKVRIFPNHACATASQHDGYVAMFGDKKNEFWPRFGGW